jgi:hypothetical protein
MPLQPFLYPKKQRGSQRGRVEGAPLLADVARSGILTLTIKRVRVLLEADFRRPLHLSWANNHYSRSCTPKNEGDPSAVALRVPHLWLMLPEVRILTLTIERVRVLLEADFRR